MKMILKSMLRIAVLACLGMGISYAPAQAFEEVGNNLGASKLQSGKSYAAPADDDDDDESFFSGGANPAIPKFKPARSSYAAIDVVAVCSAVLAEGSANYQKHFYDGCRKAVSQKPTRRAAR